MHCAPLAKSKILSYYHEIKQILSGRIPVPRCIKIFPAEICNHRCRGCHSSGLFSGRHPYLDAGLYYRLVDEWSGLGSESVNFGGGGEPLMHPEIGKFIEYAAARNMGVGILTNGTLLDEGLADRILSSATFVRIAMDGATRRVYAEQTGADHFELLLDNIAKVVSRRKKLKSRTTVGLKFLITRVNCPDVKRACALAAKSGVDYLQFKASRQNKYEIGPARAAKIDRVIEEQKTKLERKGFYIFGGAGKTRASGACFLNMLNATLDTDGSLYLCHAFQHRKEAHRIGNVSKKSFSEVWFSKQHLIKAKRIDPGQCRLYDCSLHQAHELVRETIAKDSLHLQFI